MNIKKQPDEYGQILDEYEQEIEDNLTGELLPPDEMAKEIMMLRQAARNSLKKDQRISIRINSFDLKKLKEIALREGLKYQSLITSILHKYAEGRL